jgi:PKD repeat protein
MMSLLASSAAAAPTVSSCGEVARFGGLDTGATYSASGASQTTGLTEAVGQSAKLVYPVAMAVDSKDPGAPDEYAIYVLDNINPQSLDAPESASPAPSHIALEYRIEKISDTGVLLASAKFTLSSTSLEPGLHAVSLAVNGPADRVYVLMMDTPTVSDNVEQLGAISAIDAWTTGRNGPALASAVGISTGINDHLKADPNTGAGELAGPGTLQGSGPSGFLSDIDGANITVYGSGQTADLALAGNKYTSETLSEPIVELIKTAGAGAGAVDGAPWTDTAATENNAAKLAHQHSELLYSMGTNPDGSLIVQLGPSPLQGGQNGPYSSADAEPNMATVGASALSPLSPTTPILPGAIVEEISLGAGTNAQFNFDAAATMGFSQDIHQDGKRAFQPAGSTRRAGTLAPTTVGLAGGAGFPNGLFAGLVAVRNGEEDVDKQNPIPGSPHTWKEAKGEVAGGERKITSPANLAVRVFDTGSKSLAMIGDVTPGHPCNLQSSPTLAEFGTNVEGRPSFVALAAGREGVIFVLVQPDLLNNQESSPEFIAPASAVGAGMGDQIVEFAPGANSLGAGQNASKWQECPQPKGSFSITNVMEPLPADTGTGEVAVPAGTTLKFDAEEVPNSKGEYESGVNLRGGAPWAYDWELEGGVGSKGEEALYEYPWSVRNTFAATPEKGHAWMWPLPTAEAKFEKPGAFTETLELVNDFGTLTAQRTVRVVKVGPIEGAKVSAAAQPTQGQPVLLKASAVLPEGDKVKDYHWSFGDGQGEDTGEAAEVEHAYAEAKAYTVTLTITDALGKTAEAKETVTVVAKAEPQQPPAEVKPETPPPKQEGPSVKPPPLVIVKPKPLTNAQKLANALKTCRKIKAKKRRVSCEKLAQKRYGAKPKKKHRKK